MKVQSSKFKVQSFLFAFALLVLNAGAYVTTSPGGGSSGSGGGTVTNVNGGTFTNVTLGTFRMFWRSNNISSTNIALDFSTNALQRYKTTNNWGTTNIFFTLTQSVTNQQFIPLEYVVIEGGTNGVHVIMPPGWIWFSEGGGQQAPNYVSTGQVLHVTIQNFSDGTIYANAGFGTAFDPDVDLFFAGLPPDIYTNIFTGGPPGTGGSPPPGVTGCGYDLYGNFTQYVSALKASGAWNYIDFLHVFPFCNGGAISNYAKLASYNLRNPATNNVVFSGSFLLGTNNLGVPTFSSRGLLFQPNTVSAGAEVDYFRLSSTTNYYRFLAVYVEHSSVWTNTSSGEDYIYDHDAARITTVKDNTGFGTNITYQMAGGGVQDVTATPELLRGFLLTQRSTIVVHPVGDTSTNIVTLLFDDGTATSTNNPPLAGAATGIQPIYFDLMQNDGVLGMAAGGAAMPIGVAQAFRSATKNLMAGLGRNTY